MTKRRPTRPEFFPCWLKNEQAEVRRCGRRVYGYDRRMVLIKGPRTFEQAFRAARALGLSGRLDIFRT